MRGFSLIEVLVTLLIVSAGMLGIASLQAQSLRASRSALAHTLAIEFAADMGERIRANRRGGAAYGGQAADHRCTAAAGATCSPARMAAHDLFEWRALIARSLPNATGRVTYAATTPPAYAISITWDDASGGATTHAITVRVATP